MRSRITSSQQCDHHRQHRSHHMMLAPTTITAAINCTAMMVPLLRIVLFCVASSVLFWLPGCSSTAPSGTGAGLHFQQHRPLLIVADPAAGTDDTMTGSLVLPSSRTVPTTLPRRLFPSRSRSQRRQRTTSSSVSSSSLKATPTLPSTATKNTNNNNNNKDCNRINDHDNNDAHNNNNNNNNNNNATATANDSMAWFSTN